MDKDFNNITNNNFNENIINESLIGNTTTNKLILDDTSSKLLFLGIIFILLILLIISILILAFLFLKKKKVNSVSNHNMILNRIILKHPNNIKINAIGFQPLQNTSNVSTSNIQQNNNLFNEIKSENLKDEIHKIINSPNSSDAGKRKRKKTSEPELIKYENKDNQDILEDNININKELSDSIKINDNIVKNNNENIKEEKPNINTQELEKEIKEQIKKYVIDENNT